MENFEQNLSSPKEVKREPAKKNTEYEKIWQDMELEMESRGRNNDWTPELRKSYLEQGAEFLAEAHDKGVETMIFMDKSARPLAGFFRELWKRLYPEEKIPAMRFMADFRAQNKRGGISFEKIATTFARSADEFNGKKVLLVDEIVETGDSLLTAADKFSDAFPKADVMVGGLYLSDEWGEMAREKSSFLDVKPPGGSGYVNALYAPSRSLGAKLYRKSNIDIEEVPGEVVTRALRGVPAKEKWSYLLRQVGKHEVLDRRSLEGIDEKIAEKWRTEEEKERLRKVRAVYEKLME